jgi:hypothetical protein
MRRNTLRRLDLVVAFFTDVAAVVALGWLIYQLVSRWARMTGRM